MSPESLYVILPCWLVVFSIELSIVFYIFKMVE